MRNNHGISLLDRNVHFAESRSNLLRRERVSVNRRKKRLNKNSNPYITKVKNINHNYNNEYNNGLKYFSDSAPQSPRALPENIETQKQLGFLVPLDEMFPNLVDRNGEKIFLHKLEDKSISYSLVLREKEQVDFEIIEVTDMQRLKELSSRKKFLDYYLKVFRGGLNKWHDYRRTFNEYFNEKKESGKREQKLFGEEVEIERERKRFNEEYARYVKRKGDITGNLSLEERKRVDLIQSQKLLERIDALHIEENEKNKMGDELLRWKIRSGSPKKKKKPRKGGDVMMFGLLMKKNKGMLDIVNERKTVEIDIVNEMEFQRGLKSGDVNSTFLTTFGKKKKKKKKEKKKEKDEPTLQFKLTGDLFSFKDEKKIRKKQKSRYNNLTDDLVTEENDSIDTEEIIKPKEEPNLDDIEFEESVEELYVPTKRTRRLTRNNSRKTSHLIQKIQAPKKLNRIVLIDFSKRKSRQSTRYRSHFSSAISNNCSTSKGMGLQPIRDNQFENKLKVSSLSKSRSKSYGGVPNSQSFSEMDLSVLDLRKKRVKSEHINGTQEGISPIQINEMSKFDRNFGEMLSQFEIQLKEYCENSAESGKQKTKTFKVTIQEEVGKGASATVYRGLLRNNDFITEIAIKKVYIRNDYVKKRFVNAEITILRELKHPSLVKYYGYKYSGREKEYSIIMEFLPKTLSRYIKKNGKMKEKDCSMVANKVLLGLEYLKEKKIIHRDLKSSNILLGKDFLNSKVVKITDFGVSCSLSRYDSTRDSAVGTPHFSAPEILQGHGYSFQADIWSLGATCLHMLTGEVPFYEFGGLSIATNICSLNIEDYINKVLKDNSKICKDFVLKCLKKNWKERMYPENLLKESFIINHQS